MGHDMEALVWETAEELDKKLAERMRRIRRRRKVSQQKLSDMSGVSYGSIKRFETTGQISLLSLTKLAMALELAEEVGISNVNLSNIKTGKVRAIRFSTLEAICRVLQCQPGDILEYEETKEV